MPNTSTPKDYSQYNEKQLFNFLNSVDKQLIKAENEQKKAIEKFKEIQLKKQMIQQALAKKFNETPITKEPCNLCEQIKDKDYNQETIQALQDAENGKNLETIEDFSAWLNEVKKEMNAEN
ncbi:hypothetical protein [Helicobacter cetorum]|uniref:hypothetical protein n=1 Tax=Helicobacter cetorum TaxID=138563 RepID=UPI000CF01F18|nr:hypothetical protein [Helicobacter cetorum]